MLDLVLLPDDYAVCRLERGEPVPPELDGRPARRLGHLDPDRDLDHLPADHAPASGVVNTPWRCLRVNGPVNLALTGILAALVNPLAEARVNIFAFSTHDTDYVLVPAVRLDEALAALTAAGHRITTRTP